MTSVAIESRSCLMDEGAQRVESYFDRARVREETSTGGASFEFRSCDSRDGFADREEESRGDS